MAITLNTSGNYVAATYVPLGYVQGKSNAIIAEVVSFAPSAILNLYELDLTDVLDSNNQPASPLIYRFYEGTNILEQPLVWQGNTYTPFPIEVSGYEITSKGTLPRPKLKVSNIGGAVGMLSYQYGELVSAKITRKRTFAKFLDAVNFVGGVNTSADPTSHYDDEVYIIDRKSHEDMMFLEYELTTAWDLLGVQIPRRQIIQNVCTWQYRYWDTALGDFNYSKVQGCPYTGTSYFDKTDKACSASQDSCGKRLTSCALRFPGTSAIIPFGGFPAVGLIG